MSDPKTKQKTQSSPVRFEAYDVAIELVAAAMPFEQQLRRHRRSLAEQMRRALQSIALNLAEGSGRRGADRLHHFRVADGSLEELRAALDVAVASGWFAADRLTQVRELCDREGAMLYRLTHPRR